MFPEVVEVVRRTHQGVTQPYVCRADDGHLYFVKGRGAGYPSLAREWVAGSLAVEFQLPVPPFAILSVPKDLYQLGRDGWLSDLGTGLVFGSREVPLANEISMTEVETVGSDLRRSIAVFDWWIKNGDRTLSEHGGNPNILWSALSGTLHVIDHNLAFDEAVTLHSLEQEHIFGRELAEVAGAPHLRDEFSHRFRGCLERWDDICAAMPDRWRFLDDLCTIETDFTFDRARRILRRHETQEMWNRL